MDKIDSNVQRFYYFNILFLYLAIMNISVSHR